MTSVLCGATANTTTSPAWKAMESSEVTLLIRRLANGDTDATAELLRVLYDELRRIAAAKLCNERPGHTYQPTELVNEAYLRLIKPDELPNWKSRGHFFSAAAEAMRRILVDHARQRKSQKRGGGRPHVSLPDELIPDQQRADKLLALEDALVELEQEDPKKATLVKLRFYAGLTIDQAASSLEISTTTADRYWAYAPRFSQSETRFKRCPLIVGSETVRSPQVTLMQFIRSTAARSPSVSSAPSTFFCFSLQDWGKWIADSACRSSPSDIRSCINYTV